MSAIGTVESLWRYPVKSMRGEELGELFASYAGVYCDRLLLLRARPGARAFLFLPVASNVR
jgi:MOSC domain-containing protein